MRYSKLLFAMALGIPLSACNVDVSTPEGDANVVVSDTATPTAQVPAPVDNTPADVDNTPPVVASTLPVDRTKTTAPDASITVTFSEPVLASSVDAAISITGPAGDVAFSSQVNTNDVVITPAGNLQAGSSYTAKISTGIQDMANNNLASEHVWQFTVASGPCTGAYPADFSLVEGQDATPESAMSKPVKGVPYVEPAYGTCVVRATDHEVEAPSGFARNDYSRRQAFNADGSMMLIYANNGYWHVYDANTLDYIRQLSMGGSDVEPQWHPTKPNLLYIFPHNGGMTIKQYNVLTDATSVVTDFRNVSSIAGHPGKTSIQEVWSSAARIWTKNEGSPSADARYWGLMVETDSFGGLGMITYDMETNAITGVYDYASDGGGIARPDHVSMSPTGDYMVGSWYSPACSSSASLGTLNNPCGLMSFSRDFSSGIGLAKLGEHSDIALDANGNDAIVMSNYDTGYVEMYSLDTGATTKLWNIYVNGAATALHVSGKNYNRKGWVLISTYAVQNPQGAELWYENKIMAVEMKANPRIYNIAHTYNQTDTYFSEPHAVVNRDFTRILYNSNWNTGDYTNIDAYMISIPAAAIPAN
jgi:hypothetical protein